MSIHHSARPLGCAGLAVALLLGCGGEERTVETGEGTVTVRDEEGGIQISGKTREGEGYTGRFGEQVELPADFPKDVPIYPGAKPTASMSASAEGAMVVFESKDAAKDVHGFYREKLESRDWQIEGDANFGGQRMLSAAKEGRGVAVAISEAEGATRIMLTLSGK